MQIKYNNVILIIIYNKKWKNSIKNKFIKFVVIDDINLPNKLIKKSININNWNYNYIIKKHYNSSTNLKHIRS